MGDILGSIFDIGGAIAGGSSQASGQKYAADKAAETARLGFDYLSKSPLATTYLPQGGAATSAIGDALGVGSNPQSAEQNLNNYFNSTGGAFQLQQGQNAITSSAANRGALRSGATLKALMKYGEGVGSTSFNNYLSQLGSLSQLGLAAGSAIGGAGSQAGATGANAISQGYGNAAETTGNMFGNVAGLAGKAVGSLF